MHPVLGHAGGVVLYTFTLTTLVALVTAAAVAVRRLQAGGASAGAASAVVAAGIAGGLAGARAWWLVAAYGPDPRAWASVGGGLVWWGGVLGGAVAVATVLHASGTSILRGADALAPPLALGLAIGRLGCHLAGDGDWGAPTALPWGVSYEHGVAGWPHPLGVRVHPAPLYEAVASVAIWSVLRAWERREVPAGRVVAIWALLAGATRAAVEVVRTNAPVALGLTAAQLVGLALAAAGGVALLWPTWSCARR